MSDQTPAQQPRIAPGTATQPPPAVIVDDAAVEARVESGATSETSPPSAWRLFLTSGSGRVGLAMFAFMLLVSLWVLFTYPLDFGSARW
ncbi:MAG TPA: hypothetical protein VHG52_04970, partial [Thermomicrobiales bacterium]|nr:hypothetical protein [Thermomicrobiales bacterium]